MVALYLCLSNGDLAIHIISQSTVVLCILENKKFFELKSKGYKGGIKRKENVWAEKSDLNCQFQYEFSFVTAEW